MRVSVFHLKPKVYGVLYLLLIPVFGLIFYSFPETIGKDISIIESMYFSTVTITTLGYGDISPVSDIGRALAATESVFGIILIGLFLNALSQVRSEVARNEEKEEENRRYKESQLARLHGYFSLIEPLTKSYNRAVIQVTTPLKARRNHYNPEFQLKDMADLYRPSISPAHDITKPAIEHYFNSLFALQTELSDLIKGVDLRLFPDIEMCCLEFISNINSFDFSGAILGAAHTRLGEKEMSELAHEMLVNHEGEASFVKGHMINGYVALYHQIKLQIKVVEKLNMSFNYVLKK